MSSRLFQRVREELGLAYAVYTFQSFHADIGMHGVYVGTGAGDGAAKRSTRSTPSWPTSPSTGCPADELAMGQEPAQGADHAVAGERHVAHVPLRAAVELYGEPYRTLDEMLALDRRHHRGGDRRRRARLLRTRAADGCVVWGRDG